MAQICTKSVARLSLSSPLGIFIQIQCKLKRHCYDFDKIAQNVCFDVSYDVVLDNICSLYVLKGTFIAVERPIMVKNDLRLTRSRVK